MQYQYKSTAAKNISSQSALCPFISHLLMFCTQGIPLHTETDTFYLCVLCNVMCFSLLFLVFCAFLGKERKTALLSCEMLPITEEDGVQNAL
jgi:hypothetical protein